MSGRTIIHEPGTAEQLQQLGIGFEKYDNMMLSVEHALTNYADMFPIIAGTKLSICKTNEFVGGEFSEIPSLALYFYYDDNTVRIVAVELNPTESYGV